MQLQNRITTTLLCFLFVLSVKAQTDEVKISLNGTERFRFDENSSGRPILKILDNNFNTVIGQAAGIVLNSGSSNVIMGRLAGNKITGGSQNVFLGTSAGEGNSSGDGNVVIGYEANLRNQNGVNNVILGLGAGGFGTNHSKSGNVLIGAYAGRTNIADNRLFIENTFSGSPLIYGEFDNDYLRVGGTLNINNEYSFPSTAGTSNQILAMNALGNLSWRNIIQSSLADSDLDTEISMINMAPPSSDRILFRINGVSVIDFEQQGNSFIMNTLSPDDNLYFGNEAGANDLTGNNNIGIGNNVLRFANENATSNNVAIGQNALQVVGSLGANDGFANTSIGDDSGAFLDDGDGNVFLGHRAGRNTNFGNQNIFVGALSGANHQSGNFNIAIGTQTLNPANRVNNQDYSIKIGHGAGDDDDRDRVLHIGQGELNSLIYGEFDTKKLQINGSSYLQEGGVVNEDGGDFDFRAEGDGDPSLFFIDASTDRVGVGLVSPQEKLTVDGNIFSFTGDLYTAGPDGVINAGGGIMHSTINYISDLKDIHMHVNGDEDLFIQGQLEIGGTAYKPGGGSWAALSDRRLKKDIVSFNDGLEQLMKINPVKFKYNNKLPNATNEEYIGILAQEMQKIAPYMVKETKIFSEEKEDENGNEIVIKEGESVLSYDATALNYILVNAVQEQQQMIEDLKKELNLLKSKIDSKE